jgi:L-lactate permease
VVLLAAWMGTAAADVVSALMGMGIVVFAARPFLAHQRPQTSAEVVRVSASWLGLTMLFDLVLALGAGRTWEQAADAYAIWNGSMWPLVQFWVAATPFIWLPRAGAEAPGRHA